MKLNCLNRIALALVTTLALAAAGCSVKKRAVYINDDANFAAVQRVAVLPLDNYTNDLRAGEKVAQVLMIELLSAQVFDVADMQEARQAMAQAEVGEAGRMSLEQIVSIGEALEAQALMVGTVQELAMDRSSGIAAPTISLHFKLLDTLTGDTIWSSVVSRQGASTGSRLFGVGGKSTNEAIQELVQHALRPLIKG